MVITPSELPICPFDHHQVAIFNNTIKNIIPSTTTSSVTTFIRVPDDIEITPNTIGFLYHCMKIFFTNNL
jgi:hypothetical protein